VIAFYDEVMRRIGSLPGVDAVAAGSFVPWRDAVTLARGLMSASRLKGTPSLMAKKHPARGFGP